MDEVVALIIQEGSKFIGQLVRDHPEQKARKERIAMLTQVEELPAEETTAAVAAAPTGVIEARATQVSLPTREETAVELRRRLARELYKAELDLAGGLKIAGKPCDCLSNKHGLLLEAAAEELISQEPSNPIYQEIIQWVRDNQPKLTVEVIESGKFAKEYPQMASQLKDFRKRVMGTFAGVKDAISLTH